MTNNENLVFQTFRKFMSVIKRRRNVISFWIFGMATNYAYGISLSAANDILEDKNDDVSSNITTGNSSVIMEKDTSDHLVCNKVGTGAILLIGIATEIVVKLMLQFSPKQIPYRVQVIVIACSTMVCFLMYGLSNKVWLNIIAVICSSITIAMGEITFLSMTSSYEETVLSAWSSGTGSASVIASLIYAGYRYLGISIRTVMLCALSIPVSMTLTYFYLLDPDGGGDDENDNSENIKLVTKEEPLSLTFKQKRQIIRSLMKYFIPLVMVLFTANFINQGLLELLYFNHQALSRESQYRWHQFAYRVGYFVTLSAYKLAAVKNMWFVPCFMVPYLAVFLFQLFYRFIPSFWILLVLVSANGVMRGVSYVSIFSGITNNFDSTKREFALGVITVGIPVGLLLAGVSAMTFHDYICSLNLKM